MTTNEMSRIPFKSFDADHAYYFRSEPDVKCHWMQNTTPSLAILQHPNGIRFCVDRLTGRYLTAGESPFDVVEQEPIAVEAPQPIIAKPEQPPFAPKQFVRIKSSGTILNVARCEKRVVHGALRWVVDDLNGMRAFAADCELIKNMELVNAETGQAVIHLPPAVRYACSKAAAVGDTVKFASSNRSVLFKVTALSPPNMCHLKSLDGKTGALCNAKSLEFVPEVTPVASADFDFDEAANKAATQILYSLAGTTGMSHEWASDIISAQIRPGVQALYAKLQHRRCDTCGANTIDRCPRCGAPQCCPQCCKIDDLTRRLTAAESERVREAKACEDARNELLALRRRESAADAKSYWTWQDDEFDHVESLTCDVLVTANRMRAFVAAEAQLAIAKLLLGQCDNRMFLVGDFELRKAPGGWRIYCPPAKLVLTVDDVYETFPDPIGAAQRAKELSAAKGGAA